MPPYALGAFETFNHPLNKRRKLVSQPAWQSLCNPNQIWEPEVFSSRDCKAAAAVRADTTGTVAANAASVVAANTASAVLARKDGAPLFVGAAA